MNKTADSRPALKIAGALDLAPSPERCPVDISDHYGHFIDDDERAEK